MKTPYLNSCYIGDTKVDLHGYDTVIEEVFIADTDIDITALIYSLNWDKFTNSVQSILGELV
jgi:hypothetical protein